MKTLDIQYRQAQKVNLDLGMPDIARKLDNPLQEFEKRVYRNITSTLIISVIMALVGYSQGGMPVAYIYWSWIWGLKFLYPKYKKKVKSKRFSFQRAYGYFHYGASYICLAMLFGAFGGGIYKFIIDLQIIMRRSAGPKLEAKTEDISRLEGLSKKCPGCLKEISIEAKVWNNCTYQFAEAEIVHAEKYLKGCVSLKEKEPFLRKMDLLFRLLRVGGGFFGVVGLLFIVAFFIGLFKAPQFGVLVVLGILSSICVFHAHPAGHSTVIRPPIPRPSGH